MNKEEVKKSLSELLKFSREFLVIELISEHHRHDRDLISSNCKRKGELVYLTLLEKDINTECWASSIALAFQHLDDMKKELTHDINHPNTFKGIQASFNLSRLLTN